MRRIAVTGLGVVSPLGDSLDSLFAQLSAGKSGIKLLDLPRCETLRSPLGAPATFNGADHFDPAKCRIMDRVSQLAVVAARQAIVDAALDLSVDTAERCGVSVGCSMGGVITTDDAYYSMYGKGSDRVQPLNIVAAMSNAPAGWIANEYGLSGPALTYSTACSSSAVAIGEAARRVERGDADVMIAGGAEAPLTCGVLRAWAAMRTMASIDALDPGASCRPFSRNRTGLVIGEGAAFVVLEEWEHARSRGATMHGEFAGYGLTTDHAHITRPTPEGQASAMRAALRSAGLQGDDIDYINAHGTATSQNDSVETAAIKSVFGPRAYLIPVSSTKSTHGHLLGAAGALEFVISIGCLKRRLVPPTMHLSEPDPVCDLDYVADGARRDVPLDVVMSNSFAFGGTNAVLIACAASTK